MIVKLEKKEPLNGDHLFEIAYKRMAKLPGELMDLSYWANKVSILSFKDDSSLSFNIGPYKVSDADCRLVPVFAALGLGTTGKALGDVLYHHGAGFDEIIKLHIYYRGYEEGRDGHWIFRLLMTAIFEHPDLVRGITPAREYLDLHKTIDLALLQSPFEHLWPIKEIEKYLEKRSSGIDPEPECYCPRPLSTLNFGHPNLAEEKNEQIITLLHRAGVLQNVPEAEFGLNARFFAQLFQEFTEYPNIRDNIKVIFRALNNIEDEALLKQIGAMIIQTFSNNDSFYDDDHRHDFFMSVNALEGLKYQTVRESMVLMLNVLSIEDRFLCVTNDRDAYLQRLHDELIQVNPDEFRAHHFRSLANIAKPFMEPQVTQGIDLNGFLSHILEGLRHQQSLALKDESDPAGVFLQAREDAEAFVRYASKIMEPDYARLKSLPSEAKAILAANGFDIKKLPGLSNKHRGQLLSAEMGL
jgi:hypothetical protein